MLSSFKLDSKEVSLLPSTQMTCPRRSSKEEGQEQQRGHDWAGLETWGSLTSKTSGAKCAGACLPGSSSQARRPKEERSAKMKCPLSWQMEAGGSRPFPPLRDGFCGLEVRWVVGSCCEWSPPCPRLCRSAAVRPCKVGCEPSRGNGIYSSGTFLAALLGIKG